MPASITIDASALDILQFRIAGLVPGWTLPGVVQCPDAAPGSYGFEQGNGSVPLANFQVGADGLVDFPSRSDTYLQGRGTSTLRFVGLPVVLDARGVQQAASLFRLEDTTGWLDATQEQVLQLLPARYQFGQPNGRAPAAIFEIDADGGLVLPEGDFIAGDHDDTGRPRVSFLGHAVVLDATALAAANDYFRIPNLTGWLPAATAQVFTLMPNRYPFEQPNGDAPEVWFELEADGSVSVPDGGFVTADTGTGTHARVNFEGFPILLDATPLAASNENFRLPNLTGWMPAAEPRLLNLMPNRYGFEPPVGETRSFFDVAVDGRVVTPAAGFITTDVGADGSRRVVFQGFPLVLDATALSPVNPNFRLANFSAWMAAAEPQTRNLMPARYQFEQPNGDSPDVYFDLDANGAIDVPAGGFVVAAAAAGQPARVGFVGFRIALDASAMSGVSPLFRLADFMDWRPVDQELVLSLMPHRYEFEQPIGPTPAAVFDVTTAGAVEPIAGGFVVADMNATGLPRVRFTGHAVTLDATALAATLPSFRLAHTDAWLSTTVPHTLNLMPASYELVQPSALPMDADFDVDSAGLVRVPAGGGTSFGALAGDGSSTLRLVGHAIAIDATAVASLWTSLVGVETTFANDRPCALALVPGRYQVRLSNGPAPGAMFDVAAGGTVHVDPAPAGAVASMQGDGTTRLTLTGCPITIDASALSTRGFALVNVTGTLSSTSRVTLRLMPGHYDFATPAGTVAGLGFDVLQDGTVGVAPAPAGCAFRLDGAGTPAVKVIRAAQPIVPRDELIRLLW